MSDEATPQAAPTTPAEAPPDMSDAALAALVSDEPKAEPEAKDGDAAPAKDDAKGEKGEKKDEPKESTKEKNRPEVLLRKAKESEARAERFRREGEQMRAQLDAKADEIRADLSKQASEVRQQHESYQAALKDPEKLIDLAAKASGLSHKEVLSRWVHRLQTGSPAPEEQVSPITAELKAMKDELAALKAERENTTREQARQQAVAQAKREIAETVTALSDEMPLFGGWSAEEVTEAAYNEIASEYQRSKRILDTEDVLRTLHDRLEQNEQRLLAVRQKRANTPAAAGRSTSGSAERNGARPPSTTLASSNGGSQEPVDWRNLSDDERMRLLVNAVG